MLANLGLRYGDKAPPTDVSFHRCMQCDLEMLKPVEERQPEEFANYRIDGLLLSRLLKKGAG
jgi:hypothetical protein